MSAINVGEYRGNPMLQRTLGAGPQNPTQAQKERSPAPHTVVNRFSSKLAMSLFRAREWRSSKIGCNETFSDGSLSIWKQDRTSIILVGSLQGTLRALLPIGESLGSLQILFEAELDASILQVEVGSLIKRSEKNTTVGIAILHPLRVAVYAFYGQMIKFSLHNQAHQDQIREQHSFRFDQATPHFLAFSMCLGPFGGACDHDRILVQSTDGRIVMIDNCVCYPMNVVLASTHFCRRVHFFKDYKIACNQAP